MACIDFILFRKYMFFITVFDRGKLFELFVYTNHIQSTASEAEPADECEYLTGLRFSLFKI